MKFNTSEPLHDPRRFTIDAHNMTIAPCIFGTPMLFGMTQEVPDSLAASVPFPSRLRTPADHAKLVQVRSDRGAFRCGEYVRPTGRSALDAVHRFRHPR